MRISSISNLNFTKSPSRLNVKKQKVKIFNPEPQQDPEKILIMITKSPALFCSGGLKLREIVLDPERGFAQSSYTPIDGEENIEE